jgi:hypothetical protein
MFMGEMRIQGFLLCRLADVILPSCYVFWQHGQTTNLNPAAHIVSES